MQNSIITYFSKGRDSEHLKNVFAAVSIRSTWCYNQWVPGKRLSSTSIGPGMHTHIRTKDLTSRLFAFEVLWLLCNIIWKIDRDMLTKIFWYIKNVHS